MNARDRIAQALLAYRNDAAVNWKKEPEPNEDDYGEADAVLAILPELFTKPPVVKAVTADLRRWEVKAVAGINYEATPIVAHSLLTAAAKALQGGAP